MTMRDKGGKLMESRLSVSMIAPSASDIIRYHNEKWNLPEKRLFMPTRLCYIAMMWGVGQVREIR